MLKNLPATQEMQADKGSILGPGRSLEVGNGNPLQYSCLKPMDRRAWKAAVHMVAKSQTQLSIYEKIYFCFIDYTKAFDCVNHNKLWKIIKGMGKRWAFLVV